LLCEVFEEDFFTAFFEVVEECFAFDAERLDDDL